MEGAHAMKADLSRRKVRVTDHAVLRYMERAMNLNIEVVREHIAAICAGPVACGASAVRSEGVKFEIVGCTITTVVPDSDLPAATTRERNQVKIQRSKQSHA
jgi:hypothetical protein